MKCYDNIITKMLLHHRGLQLLQVSLILASFACQTSHGCLDTDSQIVCLISHEINHCQMNRIVFIVDENYTETKSIYELFIKFSVEHTFYDAIKNQHHLEEIIEQNSDKQMHRPTSFILMTSRFRDVLYAAEQYFHTVGRKRGSIIPHSTKWLVFARSQDEIDVLIQQQYKSTFDHVAAVHLGKSEISNKLFTFMWRAKRVRTPDILETDRLYDESKSCFLFPNIRYGLNGRHLTTLTKVHWGFFVAIRNNSKTGHPEYHGFMFDVIDALMASMNFTYMVFPHPSEDQIPWDKYAQMTEDGDIDFGLTTWAYSWGTIYNFSFTSPVLMDSFTGIYRRQLPAYEFNSFFIVCPFSPLTYVLLTVSCVYTSFLYVFIVGFIYPHERVESFRTLGIFSVDQRKYKTTETSRDTLIKTLIVRLGRRAWTFVASIMNQAYLPRPQQMSARILLFLWSLAIVMFYAIYTGSLTAEMVARPKEAPFKSFEEMIEKGNYQWGTFIDSAIHHVMNSTKSGVIGILNRKAVNFPDAFAGDIYDTLTTLLENLEENYVFIHFYSLLNQIRAVSKNPGHFNLITDSLFSANQGFICPLHSEVCELFSVYIDKLHESGLMQVIYDGYTVGNGTTLEEMDMEERAMRQNVKLEDIRWPLYIVAIVLMISMINLFAEMIIGVFHRLNVDENKTPDSARREVILEPLSNMTAFSLVYTR